MTLAVTVLQMKSEAPGGGEFGRTPLQPSTSPSSAAPALSTEKEDRGAKRISALPSLPAPHHGWHHPTQHPLVKFNTVTTESPS